jgi:hypothetical protein
MDEVCKWCVLCKIGLQHTIRWRLQISFPMHHLVGLGTITMQNFHMVIASESGLDSG